MPIPPTIRASALILVEQIDRRLASALLVRRIVHYRDIADFSVLDVYQREDIAMPEVARTHGVQSSGMH